MSHSVVDPINLAIQRTQAMLFKPFAAAKWFVLGFCAFLAHLGEGGGAYTYRMPGSGFPGNWDEPFRGLGEVQEWVHSHAGLLIFLAGTLFLFVLALSLLFLWLRSHGAFIFLDGVVHDRAKVVEPWKRYAPQARSLFGFTLCLALAGLVLLVLVIGGGLAFAWHDIRTMHFTYRSALALLGGLPLLLLLALGSGIVGVLLQDFVVPAMYLRRLGVLDAWQAVRDEILAGQFGLIVLYFLMKIGLAICVGMVAAVVTCLSCCIAALPYLSSVILLPLFVFSRAYPLYFLEQFGERWRFFEKATEPA
jgi:hypothetical protein